MSCHFNLANTYLTFSSSPSMQGADILCDLEEVRGHSVSPVAVGDLEALGEGRRYTVNDELVSALLQGVRMCL